MNATDKWMLEQMQQVAAAMANSLPRVSQTNNSQPAKTEKGESFQDLMNKAKEQKAEAPKQEAEATKQEDGVSDQEIQNVEGGKPVQQQEAVQKTEGAPQQVQTQEKTSGAYNFDNAIAALVAAGFVQVDQVYEDGTVDITMNNSLEVGEIFASTGALAQEDGALTPVTLTTGEGQRITVSPQELQKVFDTYGLEGPQKSDSGAALVGQLDLSKHQDMKVLTTDGKFTTLREAVTAVRTRIDTGSTNGSTNGITNGSTNGSTEKQDDSNLDAEVMTESQQPLFRDVEAAPVKVGENFRLDTQEPDMEQKLADTIRYAAREGIKEVTLMLSPENLGNLTIKVTQGLDGALEVVLHTANPKAAALLNQHMDGLNTLLQGYGQTEVRVEVQHSEDSQQSQQQNQQQTDPNGHNQQNQQQRRHPQDNGNSGDFVQKLRLGLFRLEDVI